MLWSSKVFFSEEGWVDISPALVIWIVDRDFVDLKLSIFAVCCVVMDIFGNVDLRIFGWIVGREDFLGCDVGVLPGFSFGGDFSKSIAKMIGDHLFYVEPPQKPTHGFGLT